MADSPRIEELRRRVQLDPASIAFAALAEEYRRAGRFEESIATCIAGLQRHPSYLSAHVTLGRSLLEVGRYEDAQEELEHVLQLAPENLAAIRGIAEIHHRRGDDGHASYNVEADTARREAAAQEPPAQASPAGDFRLKPDATEPTPSFEATPPFESTQSFEPTPPFDPAQVFDALPPPTPRSFDAPVGTEIDEAPALAGLESFLAAILRARADRPAAR